MKKGLFGCFGCLGVCVVVIAFFAIMGAIFTGGSDSDSGNKSKGKDKGKTYKVGDTVKLDGLEFTVNNVSTAKQVGTNGVEQNAKGEFVVLNVTVKNNNDKSLMMNSNYFKLIKGDTMSEADTVASTSANQESSPDNTGFLGETINPENEQTAKVVFDVSSNIANSNDKVVQVQSGAFGTKTAKIKLN